VRSARPPTSCSGATPEFTLANLFVAVALAADSIAFQKFTSSSGKFSVDMPGKPVESTDKHMDWTQYTFAALAPDKSVYRVEYIQFAPNNAPQYANPQEGLTRFRDGFRKGKIIHDDKVISLGQEKVPGREYWIEADPGVYVRERLFRRGDRLYIMHVVAATKDLLTSADANRFFDSFSFMN
jgi:hypothetical protein